jgi:hypothetical protein
VCGGVSVTATSILASDQALSCIETISYEGRDYSPWCAPVRPAFLSEDVELRGDGLNEVYTARFIEGVPPEEALAVSLRFKNAPRGTQELRRECGRWRFAPEQQLSDERAESLARRVVVPDALNLS